ncbi:DUF1515 family protein [uncultured Martelella sp.]|uniref:DUF1515 family protein n=1 Tax=uncultured Martelella sp. TaxID=392331 RepID=UPI0029C841AE|nr:DUF1515 family protein [uncultured Martelella sp.]
MAETDQITNLILQRMDQLQNSIDNVDRRMVTSEDRASASRRSMHRRQEEQGQKLVAIEHRLGSVEKSVSDAAPTLEDYAMTKAKVEGAGALGRFLWTLGGVLLAIALWIVARWDGLIAWLTSR